MRGHNLQKVVPNQAIVWRVSTKVSKLNMAGACTHCAPAFACDFCAMIFADHVATLSFSNFLGVSQSVEGSPSLWHDKETGRFCEF